MAGLFTSSYRRGLLLVLALAALGIAALLWTRGPTLPDTTGWKRQEAQGLSLLVPPDWTLDTFEDGIVLQDARRIRQLRTVELYLGGGPPERRASGLSVTETGARPAPFAVLTGDGGSGGPQYALLTTRIVGTRAVTLLASDQSERGVPAFAVAWGVWQSLRAAE